MGILKTLFGKDNITPSNKEENMIVKPMEPKSNIPSFHLKGKPDSNGLYPSELVMLSVAGNIKTTETDFAGYLKYTYEIANPLKMLKNLSSRGYLSPGVPKQILSKYKVAELKEIATAAGIMPKGKKSDIIAQLNATDDTTLETIIRDRYWVLTDRGKKAINDNPYIEYFLSKHNYSMTEVGINIWTVNEEFVVNPKRPYRDIIFRQLNKKMIEASIDFQSNPHSGSASTYMYCMCYRLMGLFMEEEGKSYISASDYYFQYLYNWINVHAGLQLLRGYKLFKTDKAHQSELLTAFYNDIKLYPGQREEMLRLIDELDISGDEVRQALITSFARAQFSGIMTPQEAADFVILELSGDVDQSNELALKIAKRAVRKVK